MINTPHPASPELASNYLKISERGHDAYFTIAFYGPETYKSSQGEIRIRCTEANAIGACCWIADVRLKEARNAPVKGFQG